MIESRCDEAACWYLIRLAQQLGGLGGCVVAHPDEYSSEEVRIAHETIQRLRGDRYAVVRGTITTLKISS